MSILNKLPNNIRIQIEQQQEDLLDGYIRFLKENEIEEVLSIIEQSSLWEGGIPFATTAFADVFAWNDGFVVLYKFSEADYNVILSGTTFFFENVNDVEYQKDYFDMELFAKAVDKCGHIKATDCYTLEPIPALGGAREIAYVHIGELKTYLNILIGFE